MLGGNSWVAARPRNRLSGWLRAPVEDGGAAMVQAHTFEPQGSPVVALALSGRERSFATVGRDGDDRAAAPDVGARPGDAAAARAGERGADHAEGGRTAHARGRRRSGATPCSIPHPEISWKTLFGKVWYEGYAGPEYVWQSTGATDDIEPKFSLVPLIFGTIKGTLYAMLFAVPLAVLAALYTSQFADPSLRAKIKPTVEIMAALPSVVIGFLAGLYLASVVERNLVAVILMMPLHAAVRHVWRSALAAAAHDGDRTGSRPGTELALIVPLLLLAGWVRC